MSVATVPQVLVREAEPPDLPACVTMAVAVAQDTLWRTFPLDLPALAHWLATMPAMWVAEEDGQLIGLCGASLGYHPAYPRIAYVREELLYVLPAYRYTRAGERLLRRLRAWGRTQQAQAVVVGRLGDHEERIRWYVYGGCRE